MMFRHFLFGLFTFGLLIMLVVRCGAPRESLRTRVETASYSDAWRSIDSLDQRGRYGTAQPLVATLLHRSTAENNPAQARKALLYDLKLRSHLEDAPQETIWPLMRETIEAADFPTREVLQITAGSVLWDQYNQLRWTLKERISEVTSDDIRMWSDNDFHRQISSLFQQALSQPEALFALEAGLLTETLSGYPDACSGLPTMLDVLAAEAVDYYLSDETNFYPLSRAVSEPSVLLSGPEGFAAITPNELPRSQWHRAIELFQMLDGIHASNGNQLARAEWTIERISKFRGLGLVQYPSQHIEHGLEACLDVFTDTHALARMHLALANHFEKRGQSAAHGTQAPEERWLYVEALNHCEKVLAADDIPEQWRQEVNAIQNRIGRMEMDISTEQTILPGEPWKILINYRNISELYYTVEAFDYETYREIMSLRTKPEQVHQIVTTARLRGLPHRIPLNDEGDHFPHALEIAHEPLEEGFYVLIAAPSRVVSMERTNVVIAPFFVSNVAWMQQQGVNRQHSFRFLHRKSGRALSNMRVEIYEQRYHPYQKKNVFELLGEQFTNSTGELSPNTPDRDIRIAIKAFHADKEHWVEPSFYQPKKPEPRPSIIRHHLFTDRQVYRPGQTVYFKGIAVNHDGDQREIVSNHQVSVILYDAGGQKAGNLQLTSNDYGSYHGSFVLPSTGLTGTFRIDAGRDARYFSVEEYRRPTFRVDIEPIQETFSLGDSVLVKGVATALAGFPVAGGEVTYRIVRRAERPWWRWMPPHPLSTTEIFSGTTRTDESGRFTFSFEATEGAEQHSPGMLYRFEVIADVTDASGETRGNTRNMRIGREAFALSADFSERMQVSEFRNKLLLAVNPEGEPVDVTGKLQLVRLQMPEEPLRNRLWPVPDQMQLDSANHRRIFPNDAYRTSPDIDSAARMDTVWQAAVSPNENLLFGNVPTTLSSGWYLLEARATDRRGNEATLEQRITLFNPSQKKAPTMDFLWSHTSADRAQPGETITLWIASGARVKVWAETEVDRKITRKQKLELNNNLTAIEVPVTEDCRGDFAVHLSVIHNNRAFTRTHHIAVPYTNKELTTTLHTFRDKVEPGDRETWELHVARHDGKPADAEVLAAMYDASLDALGFKNIWNLRLFQSRPVTLGWSAGSVNWRRGWNMYVDWNEVVQAPTKGSCKLNRFGYSGLQPRYAHPMMSRTDTEMIMLSEADEVIANDMDLTQEPEEAGSPGELFTVPVRKDFRETAFFEPQLYTDAAGSLLVRFTVPEALTTWKWMALAHSKDMAAGSLEQEVVSQKSLMVLPNLPRLLRVGDEVRLASRVSNTSEKTREVTIELTLEDGDQSGADTPRVQDSRQRFVLNPGETKAVYWEMDAPQTQGLLAVTVRASTEGAQDGERHLLPVLPRRVLMTETMPFALMGQGERSMVFDALKKQKDGDGRENHALILESSTNPAWYALQALPFLANTTNESAEQAFTKFFSHAMGGHILQANPAFAETWNSIAEEDLPASNLERNQDVKNIMLDETPWMTQAQNQQQQINQIAGFLNAERNSEQQREALQKLRDLQGADGTWSWFPGMRPNRNVTHQVLAGFGRLRRVNAIQEENLQNFWQKGVPGADKLFVESFEKEHRNQNSNRISHTDAQYLWMRSYFTDLTATKEVRTYMDSCFAMALADRRHLSLHGQAMLGLAAARFGQKELAGEIRLALREQSRFTDELGRYWRQQPGYFWYEREVETSALMAELFGEAEAESDFVSGILFGLLRHKQTNHWPTSTATMYACYALLMQNTEWVSPSARPEISVGRFNIVFDDGPVSDTEKQVQPEAGSGYFRAYWKPRQISPAMAELSVKQTTDSPLWGAVYWQYFQDADAAQAAETHLKLKRSYFVVGEVNRLSKAMPVDEAAIRPGSRVLVRLELETERSMEFMHLSDTRPAGFEPVESRSGVDYSGGLGFYRSVRDGSTHFFIEHMPPGRYVLEYEIRAALTGDFSSGIARLQSMYAPEFIARSKGERITIQP
ncbi:MAG: hypothetical protein EA392_04395 [Cryomorphaceae bacterium]|nr:MAG: hypothetical protein EA392_04395 [Cryomorphaceae bacterium]